ncbi:MAG TPA: hypothetical protein VFT64_01695 [Rickettsiales bacterium]|nr:hypothetical protein [Rickettsiales bacterium]
MFKLTLNQIESAYGVYTVTNLAGEYIFIGHSRISSLLSLSDIRENPRLDKTKPMIIEIIRICFTQTEAQKVINEWIHLNSRPMLNLHHRLGYSTVIRCNQTNQVFCSQAEAAMTLGICRAWLSKHLRNIPGHKSYRGLSFSKVENLQTHIQPAQLPSTNPAYPMPSLPMPPQALPAPPFIPSAAQPILPVPPVFPPAMPHFPATTPQVPHTPPPLFPRPNY